MIEIRKCSADDFNIRLWNDLLKNYSIVSRLEYYYELWINGNKCYLLNQGNSFYILDKDKGIDQFSVVDNQVVYYHCGLSGISLKGGNIYKYDNFNRLVDFISLLPYVGDEVKYQCVNASLTHIHYDYEAQLKFSLSYYYDASFNSNDRISAAYFNEPYYVEVEKLGKTDDKKTYFLTHWYEEEKYYDMALLKTVGVVDYLSKSYAGEIDVYYDRQVKRGNEISFKNLLFSEQLNPDDIDNVLLEDGFDGYVSQDIIDAFNREDNRYVFYQSIYDEWLKVSKSDRLSYELRV